MIDVASRTKGLRRRIALLCGIGIWALSLTAIDAAVCEGQKAATVPSGLQISQAWSPTAPPTVSVHAGYFTLVNHAGTPLVIVKASSPWYEQIDMHRTTLTNGMTSMHAVDAITMAPGAQVEFVPGGLHLMMMNAQGRRQVGDRFPVTLHFQSGATCTFELTVKTLEPGSHAATPVMDTSMHKSHKHHGH